jgi:hypothetical protein
MLIQDNANLFKLTLLFCKELPNLCLSGSQSRFPTPWHKNTPMLPRNTYSHHSARENDGPVYDLILRINPGVFNLRSSK